MDMKIVELLAASVRLTSNNETLKQQYQSVCGHQDHIAHMSSTPQRIYELEQKVSSYFEENKQLLKSLVAMEAKANTYDALFEEHKRQSLKTASLQTQNTQHSAQIAELQMKLL